MSDISKGADSLAGMAQRACMKHVHNITDFGDTPVELVMPILMRVEDPQHLSLIQKQRPDLADDTADLWKRFIKRDISKWETRIFEPKDPKDWCKVYELLEREENLRKAESEAQLEAKMQELAAKKKSAKTTFVEGTFYNGPRPPRVFYSEEERNKARGTRRSPVQRLGKPGEAQKRWGSGPVNRTWNFGGPATGARALKNAKSGGQVIKVIRNQSSAAQKQRTLAKSNYRGTMGSTPPLPHSQVLTAPKGMVMDKMPIVQRPAKSRTSTARQSDNIQSLHPMNKTRSTATHSLLERAEDSEMAKETAAKEERLRRLTAPGAKPIPNQSAADRPSPTNHHDRVDISRSPSGSPPSEYPSGQEEACAMCVHA